MKTNLWVDLGIFAAFLVAFEPGLTGIAIHEWFSLAFAGTIVLHLILHWKWMVSVTVHFFKKVFHTTRLDYVVDGLLFIAFTAVMLSGLMISESVLAALGIPAPRQPVWRILHTESANLTLLLTGVHFALHWNWVVNAFSRVILQPIRRLFGRAPLRPSGGAIQPVSDKRPVENGGAHHA
jgi:hypothetical protein